jgi:hypothetical protein
MNRSLWISGVVGLVVGGLVQADQPGPQKGDPRASQLMEQAAKTRYVWSPEITAVSGKVVWRQDGKSGSGTFRCVLRQSAGLTITADGNGEVPAEVKEHVGSLIGHRTPPAPGAAARLSPPSVILVEDEDRGPLIMTVGDKMQSTQRVKEGKMVQVNRLMGTKRFTIDVTQFEKSPDGHYYPSAFTVTWWDAPTGKKTEKQVYTTQGFHIVDGQMFPKGEKVVSDKDEKTSTLELEYSDIKFDTGRQRAEAK